MSYWYSFIDEVSDTKFVTVRCRDITLPEEESELVETVGDPESYWSVNKLWSVKKAVKASKIIAYDRIRYTTGVNKIFIKNLMLELISKSI